MSPLLTALLLVLDPAAADGDTPTLGPPGETHAPAAGKCVSAYPRATHDLDTPLAQNTAAVAQTCLAQALPRCDPARAISQQAARCIAMQAGLSDPQAYLGYGSHDYHAAPRLLWTVVDWSTSRQRALIDAETGAVLLIDPAPIPVPGRPATIAGHARRAAAVLRAGWS